MHLILYSNYRTIIIIVIIIKYIYSVCDFNNNDANNCNNHPALRKGVTVTDRENEREIERMRE